MSWRDERRRIPSRANANANAPSSARIVMIRNHHHQQQQRQAARASNHATGPPPPLSPDKPWDGSCSSSSTRCCSLGAPADAETLDRLRNDGTRALAQHGLDGRMPSVVQLAEALENNTVLESICLRAPRFTRQGEAVFIHQILLGRGTFRLRELEIDCRLGDPTHRTHRCHRETSGLLFRGIFRIIASVAQSSSSSPSSSSSSTSSSTKGSVLQNLQKLSLSYASDYQESLDGWGLQSMLRNVTSLQKMELFLPRSCDSSFWTCLCRGLAGNASLEKVVLGCSLVSFDSRMVEALASALEANGSLRSLWLLGFQADLDGGLALVRALRKNASLESFPLELFGSRRQQQQQQLPSSSSAIQCSLARFPRGFHPGHALPLKPSCPTPAAAVSAPVVRGLLRFSLSKFHRGFNRCHRHGRDGGRAGVAAALWPLVLERVVAVSSRTNLDDSDSSFCTARTMMYYYVQVAAQLNGVFG